MVKAYLRYEHTGAFGVVSSGPVVADASGKHLIAAALENVVLWSLKAGQAVRTLVPARGPSGKPAGEVTELALSPCSPQVAVGHSDGTVRVWNIETGDCDVTLTGHKSPVTALRFNRGGLLLASGSQDTQIVVWDVVGEMGLYRLSGHRDQVTDVAFLEKGNKLVSSSKDAMLKVWDLETRHCLQTVASQKGELWSLDIDPQERRLAVGSTDQEVRVFQVLQPGERAEHIKEGGEEENGGEKKSWPSVLEPIGALKKTANGRCASVRYSRDGRLLGVMSVGKAIEVFRLLSEEEMKKKVKRRKKRRKEKAAAKAGGKEEGGEGEEEEITAADEMAPLATYYSKFKLRSMAFRDAGGRDTARGLATQLTLGLVNNCVEVVDVMQDGTTNKASALDLAGHRADIRSVALSSDDTMLLSTSSNSTKVWNPRTGACLRTVESGYGLSSIWAPGNRHAVIGTKDGKLQIVDIGLSMVTESIEDAHTGAVWSIVSLPDRSGFVSGSADKTVKFWEWVLSTGEGGSKKLSCENTRTLKLTEDVLCCRISPDGRMLAVALLDCTIKVFFVDSLKFHLSLYGHKLPVLSMDISSDGTLLASGSADKNIKFWGLDFGDCHRSVFAHNDSVMGLAFVPDTHYLFSIGKDAALKYWDADKWELLLELRGHHSEVWCLAVAATGEFVVSGGHDKSLRRWERTEEPFFVEEEREKRLESLFEADLETQEQKLAASAGSKDAESGVAGERTLESITATDRIVEALEMSENESKRIAEHEEEQRRGGDGAGGHLPPNILMLGLSPSAYVLKAVSGVRAADLEQALMCLPFTSALALLGYLKDWLQNGTKVELTARLAVLLLRLHHAQLMGTPSARPILSALRKLLRRRVTEVRNLLGANIAGLQHLQRAYAAEKSSFGEDAVKLPVKRTLEAVTQMEV